MDLDLEVSTYVVNVDMDGFLVKGNRISVNNLEDIRHLGGTW